METSLWVVETTGNKLPSFECVLFFCKGTGGYSAVVLDYGLPDLCSKSEAN